MRCRNTKKLQIREMVLCAVLAAVLFVVQVALSFLPNIELVSLLILVYTLVLGRRTLFIIYVFALLEGLMYGFGIWWVMYLYVWTILYVIVRMVEKSANTLVFALIGGFYGLSYGFLCSFPYLFVGGVNMGLAWWIRGIPYDLVHGISNFIVILVLFPPIYKVVKRIHFSYK